MSDLVLLGPQRRRPRVAEAVSQLGLRSVCAVTAGWQERADEVAALEDDLKIPIRRLDLYRRGESVFEEDPEFFNSYRARQDSLRTQQEVYRLRLNSVMRQCLDVWSLPAGYSRSETERRHAINMVRELDRHHLATAEAIHRDFDERHRPLARPAIRRHRRELKSLLASSEGILVAGGHVAVLLNRLRLFGLKSLIDQHPVVAWSGGAMVLGAQLVLFHDDPPQGAGFAEVLEAGLGLFFDVQPFPDASARLRLADPDRLEIQALRFSPRTCLLLDPGTRATRIDDRWEFDCPSLDRSGRILDAAFSNAD